MARQERPTTASRTREDRWRNLTWDDLEAWAGGRSLERGPSYERSGRVKQLARSAEGVLLAWVHGGQRYVTQVTLTSAPGGDAALTSCCSCPVGSSGCKHAVAVAVAYLDALKKGVPVPEAAATDPRWQLLEEAGAADDDGDDFGDEEWEEEEEEPQDRGRGRRTASARPRAAARGERADELRGYLEGLPSADLVSYLLQLAGRYPEVARELAQRSALARGKTGELIRQARKEITRLTAQPAWVNSWTGEGSLPDYRGLQDLLEQLLAHGQADALLELGETLFTAGQDQIGESHDEGETGTALGACLDVVFRAVLASSRPDPDKLLYVIDLLLRDDYDVCAGADVVLEKEWPPAVWSAAADELARRLRKQPAPKSADDFSDRYRRDALSGWLAQCLRRAGRDAEVVPLYEAEARATGSYERLVRELIEARRLDDARRWALEGIEKVEGHWPGIARQLREHLREVAARRRDWPAVAAFRAEEFFEQPSVESLKELRRAADKAGCGPQVQAAALHFLETGVRPPPAPSPAVAAARSRRTAARRPAAAQGPAGPAWPLPAPLPEARSPKPAASSRDGPHLDVLLELALQEKRPDDVLRWFDRLNDARRSRPIGWGGAGYYADQVADAVADTHPDRSLAIYRQLAESHIARTSPSSYEAALPYLRKLRGLLQRLGREAEWSVYLAELRTEHHRKRRLLEILDRLQGRRIIDA
jgi:uncharacterized Zn finger protein